MWISEDINMFLHISSAYFYMTSYHLLQNVRSRYIDKVFMSSQPFLQESNMQQRVLYLRRF